MDIELIENQKCNVYFTLFADPDNPVDATQFEVYGAAQNHSKNEVFTVEPTGADGQFKVVIPGLYVHKCCPWRYQIFVRNKETGNEWLATYGKIKVNDRYATVTSDKIALPEYECQYVLSNGNLVYTEQYSGVEIPSVNYDGILRTISEHTENADIHVSAADREAWSEKQFSESEMPNLKKLAGETCDVSTNLVVHGMQADIMPVALFLGANTQDGHVMCFQGGIFNLTQGARQLVYSNSTTFVLGDASTQTYLQGNNFTIDVANLGKHLEDTTKHITAAEREAWNAALSGSGSGSGGGSTDRNNCEWALVYFKNTMGDASQPKLAGWESVWSQCVGAASQYGGLVVPLGEYVLLVRKPANATWNDKDFGVMVFSPLLGMGDMTEEVQVIYFNL